MAARRTVTDSDRRLAKRRAANYRDACSLGTVHLQVEAARLARSGAYIADSLVTGRMLATVAARREARIDRYRAGQGMPARAYVALRPARRASR
jgi:hypothetical protein